MSDVMPWNELRKRRGRFTLNLETLQDMGASAIGLFAELLIVRCENRYLDGIFEYEALSPRFDPIEPGLLTPSYLIVTTVDRDGNNPNFEFRRSSYDQMAVNEFQVR